MRVRCLIAVCLDCCLLSNRSGTVAEKLPPSPAPPHPALAGMDPAGARRGWLSAQTADGLTPHAFASLVKQQQQGLSMPAAALGQQAAVPAAAAAAAAVADEAAAAGLAPAAQPAAVQLLQSETVAHESKGEQGPDLSRPSPITVTTSGLRAPSASLASSNGPSNSTPLQPDSPHDSVDSFHASGSGPIVLLAVPAASAALNAMLAASVCGPAMNGALGPPTPDSKLSAQRCSEPPAVVEPPAGAVPARACLEFRALVAGAGTAPTVEGADDGEAAAMCEGGGGSRPLHAISSPPHAAAASEATGCGAAAEAACGRDSPLTALSSDSAMNGGDSPAPEVAWPSMLARIGAAAGRLLNGVLVVARRMLRRAA